MINVGISGANGTMGRLTIGAVDAVDDLTIGGLYAPGRNDQDILGYSASGRAVTPRLCPSAMS
jgi:dihydrodipicolinate reductase